MLRNRNILIWLAALAFCFVAITPTMADDDEYDPDDELDDVYDGDECWLIGWDFDETGILWLCWFHLPDGNILYEYFGFSTDIEALAHLFNYLGADLPTPLLPPLDPDGRPVSP